MGGASKVARLLSESESDVGCQIGIGGSLVYPVFVLPVVQPLEISGFDGYSDDLAFLEEG